MILDREVLMQIDVMREKIVDLTRELVRIPSINPPGEYVEISKFLASKMRKFGFEVETIEVPKDKLKELGLESPRINVLGTWPGYKGKPVLIFNAHTDVVPPGSNWTKDPFAAVVEERRICGRGAGDCKGGIAAGIMAIVALMEAGIKLTGDVILAWTTDGETGGLTGLKYLIEQGKLRGDYCIVTDAPCDCIYDGEKLKKIISKHVKRVTKSEVPIREIPESSDMCFFVRGLKIPTLMYGPLRFPEGRPHGHDEFIEINDLINVTKIYALTTMDLLGVSAWKGIDELFP